MKRRNNSKLLDHTLEHIFDFVVERIGQIGNYHEQYLIREDEHSSRQAFRCAGAMQEELMDEFSALWGQLQKVLLEYGL